MPGVEHISDRRGPSRRAGLLAAVAVAAAVAVVVAQGVVALLVVVLLAVLVGLVVALAVAAVQALRGSGPRPSGDHPAPGLRPGAGPADRRAEAGHVSPSASRS